MPKLYAGKRIETEPCTLSHPAQDMFLDLWEQGLLPEGARLGQEMACMGADLYGGKPAVIYLPKGAGGDEVVAVLACRFHDGRQRVAWWYGPRSTDHIGALIAVGDNQRDRESSRE